MKDRRVSGLVRVLFYRKEAAKNSSDGLRNRRA